MTGADVDAAWRLELTKAAAASDGRTTRRFSALLFAAATVAALAAWLRTLVLTAGDPGRLPAGARHVVALHGEVANRTLHLLAALVAEAPTTPILVLGRPRGSLARVAAEFRTRGLESPVLIRPWTLAAALASAGQLPRRLMHAAKAQAAIGSQPSFHDQAAMIYRLALGGASERWARTAGRGVSTVVFGHTGLADTTLLEHGLQAAGARTLHWAHGVSLGWNFTGHSDVAVFQCESDARWHATLGGYGAVHAFPTPRPAPDPAGQGWLLLSNLIHPMNPAFRQHGPRDEIALVEAVAEAADQVGVARGAVTWKPHPVLSTLDPEIGTLVETTAERLGLSLWRPDDDRPVASQFEVVICTPSTVALDMLRLGKLPILFGAVDGPAATSRFAVRVANAADLALAVGRLGEPAAWRQAFDASWRGVGPGAVPRLADLQALAGGGSGRGSPV